VWTYPHTTIPRHLKDVIVTEYGVADLRGKSDAETIAALLTITDRRFQDGLLKQAKTEGKIGADYVIPDEYRNNTPDRLGHWLRPYRQSGLLPEFPFGTDFTQTEQDLLPALAILKRAQNAKASLVGLAWQGLTSTVSPAVQDGLARRKLDSPSGAREYVYALLLRGALCRSMEAK
nr:hypothetical protein [Roseovarius sp.]